MRRTLLAVVLVALPLAACGRGLVPTLAVRSAQPVVTCGGPTLSCTGSQQARTTATRLISTIILPAGAVPIAVPDSGPLAQPATSQMTSSLVDVAQAWQEPESMDSVDAFVKAHPPAGMHTNSTGTLFGSGPRQLSVSFAPATPPAGMCSALVEVTIAAQGSGSALRVDGQVVSDCDHGVHSPGPGGTAKH